MISLTSLNIKSQLSLFLLLSLPLLSRFLVLLFDLLDLISFPESDLAINRSLLPCADQSHDTVSTADDRCEKSNQHRHQEEEEHRSRDGPYAVDSRWPIDANMRVLVAAVEHAFFVCFAGL